MLKTLGRDVCKIFLIILTYSLITIDGNREYARFLAIVESMY